MTVSNAQVSKLMREIEKHGELGKAAAKAGMDRKNLWLLLRKHGLTPTRGQH